MKTKILLLLFIFFFTGYCFSSKLANPSIGLKFDLNFSQAPKDLGFGLELTSPLLFNIVGLCGEFSYSFISGSIKTNVITINKTYNYYLYKIGVITSTGNKEDGIRPYMKLGFLFVNTPEDYFVKSFYSGIFGSFGIHLNFSSIEWLGIFFEVSANGVFEDIYVEFSKKQIFVSGIHLASGLKIFF